MYLDHVPWKVEKCPFKKDFALYVLVYKQQFGAENISVENAIFVIAFRTIFEKSGGAVAPASPVAARCLFTLLASRGLMS